MDIFIKALNYEFFRNALIIGVLLSAACALLGNFIILRKEAVLGDAVSSSAFLGVALGLLFHLPLSFAVIGISIIGALLIFLLQHSGRLSQDSVLELVAQVSLAGAIVIISLLPGYRAELSQYLLGNILSLGYEDFLFSLLAVALSFIVTVFLRKHLLKIAINKELASSTKIPVSLINITFLVLIAVTIAIGVRIIGILLLTAFFVIPPNSAKFIAKSFRQMMWYSVCYAIFGTVMGLFLSFLFDIPSGASIVLVLGGLLLLTICFTTLLSLSRSKA